MRRKFGEILLESGIITRDELDQELSDQKKSNMKLGQHLILKGILNEPQVADSLAKQLNLRRYRAEVFPIDTSLKKWIPVEAARKYQVVPLKLFGHLLLMAMTDPKNIEALDALERIADLEIEPVVATDQEMNNLLINLYDIGIGDVLNDIQDHHLKAETQESEESIEVRYLQDMVEEPPVVRIVNEILSHAVREKASDVHISPERESVQVRLRVDGLLHNVPAPPKNLFLPIISRLKLLSNMDISVFRIPQDGRFTIKLDHNQNAQKEINVRASTIPTIYGENMVLRLLDTSAGIYSLEKIGMSDTDREKVSNALIKPYGMLLSTGPTGSGKTTTLYSILRRINQPDINIITLEDPVEYRIDNIRQIRLNRKAGMTFASGIRAILRQDPDVIMIGEIRDAETASIAVQAALTGHRVLSTLHTNNAAGAITRFIDMSVEAFLLSSVLLLIIAQRLVRKICPYCRELFVPTESVLKFWGIEKRAEDQFYRAQGCFNCMNTGYKDRTGVFEVLEVNELVQQMIIDHRSSRDITQVIHDSGQLRNLKEDALEKVRRGITTFEEAGGVAIG